MNHSKDKVFTLLKQRSIWSFLVLFFAWIFYFWPILEVIYSKQDPLWITWCTYGITFVAIGFIVQKRHALENTLIASSQLGLATLFSLTIVFIIGAVENILYVQQSAVLLMLPALVLTVFGPVATQTLLLPLLFLMVIIPLQDNTLTHKSWFVWVAGVMAIFYHYKLKRTKPKSEGDTTPLWVYQNARWFLPTGIAFCLLMVSPWLGDNIRSFYPPKHVAIAMKFPSGVGGWIGPMPVQTDTWSPLFPNASTFLQKQYFASSNTDRDSVYLYSAYYQSNREFTDILQENNSLFDPTLWKKNNASSLIVDINDKEKVPVLEIDLRAGTISRCVWYWYYVAGYFTTDLMVADLLDKVRTISKFAQGSGVVMISTTYTTSLEEARKRLTAFLKDMYHPLDDIKRPEITYIQYNQEGR